MISLLQTRLSKARLTGMVVLLIFMCCACQAAPSPAPLPSATVVPPTTILTQTRIPPTATPAPTSTQRPTDTAIPSPEPTATVEVAGLSPGGPWLALPNITVNGMGGQDMGLVLINQDGSGHAEIPTTFCGSAQDPIIEHPANAVVKLDGPVFLVNPQLQKACAVCTWDFDCDTYTEAQNLLASEYHDKDGNNPELYIHKLPEGTLLASFPLMQCSAPSDICDESNLAWGLSAWDSAGQNLAFPVITDSGTALYLYNTATGSAQEAARFEGIITDIWWAPDGSNLIIGVGIPFSKFFVESVHVLPMTGGSPRTLYTLSRSNLHELVTWLDNDRFLAVDGSLKYVAMEGAFNLRLVDIRSTSATMLFNDGFIDLALDRKSETVVVVNMIYTSSENQGYYLFHLADPKPIYMGELLGYQLEWDEDLGLFITDALCPDDAAQILAFDPQGKLTCLPPRTESNPPPDLPMQSPDGSWSAALDNGLWIEGPGQPRVKVLEETPSNLIWRPDTGGVFAVTEKEVVYIALPGLETRSLPNGIYPFSFDMGIDAYQLIGN